MSDNRTHRAGSIQVPKETVWRLMRRSQAITNDKPPAHHLPLTLLRVAQSAGNYLGERGLATSKRKAATGQRDPKLHVLHSDTFSRHICGSRKSTSRGPVTQKDKDSTHGGLADKCRGLISKASFVSHQQGTQMEKMTRQ